MTAAELIKYHIALMAKAMDEKYGPCEDHEDEARSELRSSYDGHASHVRHAWAKIAALRADVERLTRERDERQTAREQEYDCTLHERKMRVKAQERVAELEAKLADAATVQAEHARALEARLQATVQELESERKRLLAVVASADREGREKAERLAGDLAQTKDFLNEANAANEQLEKERDEARAELEAVKKSHNYLTFVQVKMERDRAHAELAALKERKVKLPLMYGEPNKGDPPDMAHGWKMYDDAVEACAEAIRAAGIEVEA